MKAITRPNINKLLNKGLNFPFTLIVAPAGSGKSTALDQWFIHHEHSQQTNTPLKSIRFNAAFKFNQGDSLFLEIFNRLSTITPLWEASFFKLFKNDQEADNETLVDIFIQGLSLISHTTVIAIDDFHLIQSPRICSIFNDLINRLPRHITLILSSRTHPNLSISKFKLEEKILIIDGNDLKIEADELMLLNTLLCDTKVNSDQLGILLQQTEGWFVGIKLALLAYTEDGDKALEAFSGTRPELLNYFAHEVIHRLAPNIKDMILSLSICSAFDQVVCDALNEDIGNLISLDELSQHELLINPDLEVANTFRFHPLLQSFLVQQLEIEKGLPHIQALHFKAATCLLSQDKTSQAIDHARQSNHHDFYINTLESACLAWSKQGKFEPIIDALNALDKHALAAHPRLHISFIYALIFSRRFNQASFHLKTLNQHNRTQAEVDTMRFLHFLISLLQSDAEIQNLNLPKQRITEHTPTDVVGFYLIVEAYNSMYNGRLNEAFKLATQAKHLLKTIEHNFFLSYSNLIIILCDRYLGRGIEAIDLMLSVFQPLKHGPKDPIWVNIASGMIVVDYEQNRLDEALYLGEQLIPLVSHSAVTEVILNAYFYSARISHIQGNKHKSKRLLDQLERILSLGDYQRFNCQIIHERMRQALQEKTKHTVDHLYQHYQLAQMSQQGVWCESQMYEEHRERLALASAYALISKGLFEQAHNILKQVVIVLDRQHLPSRALITRSNIAMIAFRQGNKEDALRQLKRLVERYGLVCFSRTIFDETPGLEKLFHYAADQKAFAVPSLFYDIFSSLFDKQKIAKTLAHPTQSLTEKELAIFELLSEGLSNSDISKQSGIALSTTKWHLKNIYQKLGVENRSAALMFAYKNSPSENEYC